MKSFTRFPCNRTGPLSLIGARAKLLQHWADRIDAMVGNNVVPIIRKPEKLISV
jgi:hypothetical protein